MSENKVPKGDNLTNVADFLFEVGMLARVPRTGFFFLGSGKQSVAEHINRAVYIGYTIAMLSGEKVDMAKLLKMCLFHDLSEARVSDLNYVHQKYNQRMEDLAIKDLAAPLPFGEELIALISEFDERKTLESQIAKDADNLEQLLSLREQLDIGNARAGTWIPNVLQRVKTETGKKIAQAILDTESDHWWYGDKNDKWWVHRNGESGVVK